MSQTRTKQFSANIKAVTGPDAETLAAIRKFTLVDIPAEQLVVREFVLAHNCVDRDNECIDEALLARFAATLPGKGCFIKHPQSWEGDGGPAEGKVFAAHVEVMALQAARDLLREPGLALPPDRTEAHVLISRAYYVRTDQNSALLLKMDAGIAGDVSIGFSTANPPVKVSDPDGHELTLRRWMAPGEALEQSLVWLGAQPGARAIKNATRTEDHDMNLQEQLDAEKARATQLEGEVTSLKSAAGTDKAAASNYNALKAALGDSAALLEQPAVLVQAVTAGKAYRKSLVDAIVTADRTANRLGDEEEVVKAARAEYEAMPTTALERLKSAYASDGAPAAFGIQGGDPNHNRGAEKAVKGPFGNNPAFGAVAAAG